MEIKKLGNLQQVVNIIDTTIDGVRVLQCKNGKLQCALIVSKALDINEVSFCGENISFITKNGLKKQNIADDFDVRFNGGFLYTCGLDNIGRSQTAVTHGTLCFNQADIVKKQVVIEFGEAIIEVVGQIKLTRMFGEDILIVRTYKIYGDKIVLQDKIVNNAYQDYNYMMLYHFNIGYPMLDEGVTVWQDGKQLVLMRAPQDNADEIVKTYSAVDNKTSVVEVVNDKILKKLTFSYDTATLPYFTTWESFRSGDYALGIEPNTTPFVNKQARVLKSQETVINNIQVCFEEKKC